MYSLRTPLGLLNITSSKDFSLIPSEVAVEYFFARGVPQEYFAKIFVNMILRGCEYTLLEDDPVIPKFWVDLKAPYPSEDLQDKMKELIDLLEENKINDRNNQ